MNSPEKRRDMKKLQNKRRRQKWHFLRDCCVAFVGRKMKCEDQGEVEGGRGHVENGMSKSKKQKRKYVRGKTNLWEMRQESVKPACCLMDGAVVAGVEGGTEFLQVGGQKKIPLSKKEGTLQKWEMKIKVKTSFLFGGECPWQAGCADRGKGVRENAAKQRWRRAREPAVRWGGGGKKARRRWWR